MGKTQKHTDIKHLTEGVFSEDFMLSNVTAKRLYFDFAQGMPIADYHNHLSPELISVDHEFSNITEAWLDGDHYKWRAMRANGIAENFITGNSTAEEKFEKWAETVPYTLRNPLFHWTHLELKRTFGIQDYLSPENSKLIYDECNRKLSDGLTVSKMLEQSNVKVLCTTDDPADDLRFHKAINRGDLLVMVFPTFRPDAAMAIEKGKLYLEYLEQLGQAAGIQIDSVDTLLEALQHRHDYFAEQGCKVSDHGLTEVPGLRPSHAQAQEVFSKVRDNKAITHEESEQFKSYVLHEICVMNAKKNWVQQFHIGALRNNNSKMLIELGPDTGYDSISDKDHTGQLRTVLNELEMKDQLTKTIVYNLNPAFNEAFATMMGNFNDGVTPGKMQYGAAWWFLDQKKGILDQLDCLSNMGLLSRFVGMLTDSRSFLSFSRHDYFRRILCDILGKEMESGEMPSDIQWVGNMVKDICYNNTMSYFGFEESA